MWGTEPTLDHMTRALAMEVSKPTPDLSIVQELIDAGATLRGECPAHDNRELIIMAAEGKSPEHTSIVKLLLDKDPQLISVRDKVVQDHTPLICAIGMGLLETALFIIDRDTNINARDRKGQTAIMHAAKGEAPQIMQALINKKANLNAQDKDGCTALHFAADFRDAVLIEMLLTAGAYLGVVNTRGQQARDVTDCRETLQTFDKVQFIRNATILQKSFRAKPITLRPCSK